MFRRELFNSSQLQSASAKATTMGKHWEAVCPRGSISVSVQAFVI